MKLLGWTKEDFLQKKQAENLAPELQQERGIGIRVDQVKAYGPSQSRRRSRRSPPTSTARIDCQGNFIPDVESSMIQIELTPSSSCHPPFSLSPVLAEVVLVDLHVDIHKRLLTWPTEAAMSVVYIYEGKINGE